MSKNPTFPLFFQQIASGNEVTDEPWLKEEMEEDCERQAVRIKRCWARRRRRADAFHKDGRGLFDVGTPRDLRKCRKRLRRGRRRAENMQLQELRLDPEAGFQPVPVRSDKDSYWNTSVLYRQIRHFAGQHRDVVYAWLVERYSDQRVGREVREHAFPMLYKTDFFYPANAGFRVDESGIVRLHQERRRSWAWKSNETLEREHREGRRWLNRRRVGKVDGIYFWFLPTGNGKVIDRYFDYAGRLHVVTKPTFRQDSRLSDEEVAEFEAFPSYVQEKILEESPVAHVFDQAAA